MPELVKSYTAMRLIQDITVFASKPQTSHPSCLKMLSNGLKQREAPWALRTETDLRCRIGPSGPIFLSASIAVKYTMRSQEQISCIKTKTSDLYAFTDL